MEVVTKLIVYIVVDGGICFCYYFTSDREARLTGRHSLASEGFSWSG